MKTHHRLIVALRAVTAAAAFLAAFVVRMPTDTVASAATRTGASLPKVVITSAVPNPSSGPESVELRVDESLTHRVFVPMLSKAPTNTPTFELGDPPIPAGLNIGGWELSNDAGVTYVIPNALPVVPIGAKVRVIFDGAGEAANDYDLSDGLVELHTPAGVVNAFDDSDGQVSLYSSSDHSEATLKARMMWAVLGE